MHQHQGASLIEILVSLFLLSVMLFGLDALGLGALRETKNAYYVAVAQQQMSNMIEQLYAANEADFSESLTQWNKQNKLVLPQGKGEVSGSYPAFHLSVHWGDLSDHVCNQNKIEESGCLISNIKL